MKYKFYGREFYAYVCIPDYTHCSAFDEYLFYGCTACQSGYYLIKSQALYPYYETTYPSKEITLCHKCHPGCATCSTFSPYACITCNSGSYLHHSTCLAKCPTGYIGNSGTNQCDLNTCGIGKFLHNVSECVDKCPDLYYANSTDYTCSACNSECAECYGPSNSECRVCNEANNKFAKEDGTCVTCTTNNYVDALTNFTCVEYWNQDLIVGAGACSPCTGATFTGIVLTDKTGATTPAIVANASGYLNIADKNVKVTMPLITYGSSKTCYRVLIQFSLYVQGYDKWTEKIIYLKSGNTT